jgi:uncharacterized protein (TIGR00106 family)
MSVLLEFAMFPTDKGERVSSYVSRIIKMIKESGVSYQLTPMGTIIETETMQEALAIVQKAYDILQDSDRVYSAITFDIQNNKPFGRIDGKIKSVESKIGEVNS